MSTIPPKRVPANEKEPAEPKQLGHSLGAGAEAAEGVYGEGPLLERSVEHRPGYGGEGGEPRTSADQREHFDADGKLESED